MTLPPVLRLDDPARGVSLALTGGAAPKLDVAARSERNGVVATVTVDLSGDPDLASGLSALLSNPATATAGEREFIVQNLTRRAEVGFGPPAVVLRRLAAWLVTSREDTNFTYDLTPLNMTQLAHFLAAVTGRSAAEMRGLLDEPGQDATLIGHVQTCYDRSDPALKARADRVPRFGRRLGWYALARHLKPRLIVETGVDKGLGAVLMCAALRRNAEEGSVGRYLGADLRADAGYLVSGAYQDLGKIAVGDSVKILATLDGPIDLFINDSDHNPDYEDREYGLIEDKLSPDALILSDNSHATDRLARFAEHTGRKFLFFREQPARHWYAGAGIGVAFR